MSYSHHLQGLKHALFDFFFVKFIITGSKGYIIVNSCHKQLIVWVLKNHTQPLTYHGKRFFGNLNVCNTHFTLAWKKNPHKQHEQRRFPCSVCSYDSHRLSMIAVSYTHLTLPTKRIV